MEVLTYILPDDLINTACYIIFLYCLFYEIVSFYFHKMYDQTSDKMIYYNLRDQWL